MQVTGFIYAGKTKGVKRLLFHHNILSTKYQYLTVYSAK